MASLEHVNLTVSDPERSAALMATLFGWHERWRGPSQMGGWTIHVGDENGYLALYTPGDAAPGRFAKGLPLNHVGIEVDDLDTVEARAIAAGLTPFNHANYPPGRRFYVFDEDGIELEIVCYR